ncbi:MAG TPA: thioredoxin domain-containing protein [Candidatus Binataceae bacterium]|nr:thioredoxin domain-containing protein [Candidatus Binataceae bacterium]
MHLKKPDLFPRLAAAALFALAISTIAARPARAGAAATSSASQDAAVKAMLQKRLLVPDAKNLVLGPPSPGPFAGMSSRTVTLVNPDVPAQKAELELFSDADGKQVILAQHFAIVDSAHPWEQIDLKQMHLEGRATLGPADAPLTIVEFGDLQCPYCARAFSEIETVVNTTYKDRVRLIWKNFPLNVHPWAEQAAVAAECAREQKPAAFWEVVRSFYKDQSEITPQNLRDHIDAYTKATGLDQTAMNACILGKTAEDRVQQDLKDAQNAHLSSTPTFIVSGVPVIGLPSSKVFDFVIKAQLQSDHAAK